MDIINQLQQTYFNEIVSTERLILCIAFVLFLSLYEYLIYKYVCKRSFYNRAFHISIAIIPFFIAAIILCLQSNLIITLGTIGALAIIRFRTAVKDPIDMIYILWAVFIGISVGSGLYEVAVITSLTVTVVLALLNLARPSNPPFNLVIHSKKGGEDEIFNVLKNNTKKFIVKSRNYSEQGIDLFIEIFISDPQTLSDELSKLDKTEKFSILEYNYDDIV